MKTMKKTSDTRLENTFPAKKCPICGREFLVRCRPSEWGYWCSGSNGRTLFCSDGCVREFEQKQFMKRVQEVVELKSYKAYRMYTDGTMSQKEALNVNGLKSTAAIQSLLLHRWKELEWLEAHGWAV